MKNAVYSEKADARAACLAALVLAAEQGSTHICVLPDIARAIPATARESLASLLEWIAEDSGLAPAVRIMQDRLELSRATKH